MILPAPSRPHRRCDASVIGVVMGSLLLAAVSLWFAAPHGVHSMITHHAADDRGEALSGTWRERMLQGRERLGTSRPWRTGTAPIPANSHCSHDMFPNDTAAYWSCKAQFSMQQNWFPDPLNGFYSYETWNGFDGFWQNGAVLEAFANFAYYANHTRYLSVVKNSYRELWDLKLAYGPIPSYDDLAWYGLSYARIYEVFGFPDFLQVSQQLLDLCYVRGWDTNETCGGGYWFDSYNQKKQCITDLQLMHLSGRLFRLTGSTNETLKNLTLRTWRYLERQNMVNNETFLVSDGMNMHPQNCTPMNEYGPSYNMGVMIGGLIELSHMLNDSDYIELAHKIANATIVTYTNEQGVFVEYCEPNITTNATANFCDLDQRIFKGLFMRYLRYLMDVSDEPHRQRYHNFLMGNMAAVLNNTHCEPSVDHCRIQYLDGTPYHNISGPLFGRYWRGPFDYAAPEQHMATWELFTAAILPHTRCQGKACGYDPPYPVQPPHKLTCSNDPCPPNEQCCDYQDHYTCCVASQTCGTDGVCHDNGTMAV
ncbi:uncharacterized protein LOC135805457 [Sycon ciliatum]|uniref:uncharacterized protein LOC135805457 n=1 Tax=Sycon ciliatum TaxID=27933 RepID=UPI0020AD8F1E|eukprot:scpid63010/ scgid28772/ Mannan endo-1,6-alpha-mannosidase DCW1; Defective cell wall 1; Endo-alpha-1-&gt